MEELRSPLTPKSSPSLPPPQSTRSWLVDQSFLTERRPLACAASDMSTPPLPLPGDRAGEAAPLAQELQAAVLPAAVSTDPPLSGRSVISSTRFNHWPLQRLTWAPCNPGRWCKWSSPAGSWPPGRRSPWFRQPVRAADRRYVQTAVNLTLTTGCLSLHGRLSDTSRRRCRLCMSRSPGGTRASRRSSSRQEAQPLHQSLPATASASVAVGG